MWSAGAARSSSTPEYTQTAADNVRLIGFRLSHPSSASYVIEAGPGLFRFYILGTRMTGSGSVVDSVYGTSDPVPYTSDDIPELQVSQLADVLFITHRNHPPATLTHYGLNNWRYELVDFENGPYLDQETGDDDISLSLHTVVDRMTLTSTAADFTGAVAGTTLVEYAYGNHRVLGIVREATSATEVVIEPLEDRCLVLSKEVYSPGLYTGWDGSTSLPIYDPTITGTDVDVSFTNTGVITQESIGNYVRFCDKAGTYYWMLVDAVGDIVEQAAYGIIAKGDILTVVKPTGIVARSERRITAKMKASLAGFFDLDDDIGRLFRLVIGGKVLHARGLEHEDNTTSQIEVEVSRSIPRTTEGLVVVEDGTTNDWRLGAWYPGNYPAAVTFHEGRLAFANSGDQPQTGWLSKVDDIYNFATTDEDQKVLDDSAITFTIASDTINQINWMLSRKGAIIIGTEGAEWLVGPSDGRGAITPTTISAQLQSSYGSYTGKPISVGKSIIYLQQAGRKMRQMNYDYQTDSQVSLDLTVFAEHILKDNGGGDQVDYQHLPESAIFVRLGNGQVGALTYEPDQQVYAWSRFVIGGPSAEVESIACVRESGVYALYLVVTRIINGARYRTIEYMQPEFRPDSATDFEDMDFLDGHKYFGGVQTDLTGLSHLAGCQVQAILYNQNNTANSNAVFTGLTVSSTGTLTLPEEIPAGSVCIVGVPYTSILRTFPLETPAQLGTGQGQPKRIDHISLRLLDSLDFKHGSSLTSLTEERFRKATDSVISHPPMFSGDRRVTYSSGADVRSQIYIVQDKPYPLSILSLIPELSQYK